VPQFVQALTEHAHRQHLQILVTPYSIGSFDRLDPQPSPSEAIRLSKRALALWNPNLSVFSDPYEILGA